jgi:hypothetical protein
MRLRGRVEETILAGDTIFSRGEIRGGEGRLLVRG